MGHGVYSYKIHFYIKKKNVTQPQATNDIFLIKESRTERRKLFPSQLRTEGKFKKLKSLVF